VDLAMELMGLVRSRILERLLDDGGSLREFIADVKLGMAREGQEHWRIGVTSMIETLEEALKKQAGRDQPTEYPSLPAWESLSLELRGAFVSIYHRGRRDGVLDELARSIKIGG
jgi:hypothetical protein